MLPTLSGKVKSLGSLVEQALPFSLDPSAYKGNIILGDDGNIWHSDGASWRLNLTAGFLDGGTIVNTTELHLEAFATADLPEAFAHPRRVVYDSDKSRPYYSDGSTWRDIADQDVHAGFLKPQEFATESDLNTLAPAADHIGEIAQVTSERPDVRISDGTSWIRLLDVDDDSLIVLTAPLTVYVGAEPGDFSTLSDALDYLSGFVPRASTDETLATVMIRSGVTLDEQFHIRNVKLGWVALDSEDSEVLVDVSAFLELPVQVVGADRCYWMRFTGCDVPKIRTRFVRTGTNAASVWGFIAEVSEWNNSIYTDMTAPSNGLVGFELCAYVSRSRCNIQDIYLEASESVYGSALSCGSLSNVTITNSTLRAASGRPLTVFNGARVHLQTNSDIRLSDGSTAPSVFISTGAFAWVSSTVSHAYFGEAVGYGKEHMLLKEGEVPNFKGFIRPEAYVNVAALPSAALHPGAAALVLSSSVGRALVVSDGANWKVFATEGATATD